MKVLVACEYSGRVRDAFRKMGHDAMSCDLLPTEQEGPHYQGDLRDVIGEPWDLLIAHPPCTYLTVAGVRWLYHPEDKHLPTAQRRPHPKYPNRRNDQEEALEFVRFLLGQKHIKRKAIENPISVISSHIRKPDQIIQPWMFGHGETKSTCLWLEELPKLIPTDVVEGRKPVCHMMPPSENRWKERSRTYQGVADAMAAQWGNLD